MEKKKLIVSDFLFMLTRNLMLDMGLDSYFDDKEIDSYSLYVSRNIESAIRETYPGQIIEEIDMNDPDEVFKAMFLYMPSIVSSLLVNFVFPIKYPEASKKLNEEMMEDAKPIYQQ